MAKRKKYYRNNQVSKKEDIKQDYNNKWYDEKTKTFSSVRDLAVATKSTSTTSSTISKSDLDTYLSNPLTYDKQLREISDKFYYGNGIYKNIINGFANLPTLDSMILPSSQTLERKTDKSYQTYYDKVNMFIDSIDVKVFSRRVLKSVARYGAYIGYLRQAGTDVSIQTLSLDYCRVKYRVGNQYQLEFNFKYFDKFFSAEDLELAWSIYPPEFKKLYNKYKSDNKSRNPEWQMIDINSTVCILFDDEEPFFMPMFSGMFASLLNRDEYEDIVISGEQNNLQKLLLQKVPTDKDGKILMPPEMVKAFHDAFKQIIPDNANAFTTPMDVHDVPFVTQSDQREQLLSKAERRAFVDSGFSSAMFADNSGHSGLQVNIESVTANIYSVIEKIENYFNQVFKKIVSTKNYEFRLKIFKTTNINIKDNFDRMFQLFSLGGAVMPIFSLLGFDSETYMTMLQVENDLGVKDLLVPPQSAHTTSGNGEPNNGKGRPQSDEKDLKDSGQATRDLGSNDNKK